MKALSFHGEWLWCTLHAGKRIENRKQMWKHRGPLALHASLTRGAWFRASALCHEITGLALPNWHDLPRGGIVGRAVLVDVIPPRNEEIAKVLKARHRLDLRWWFRDHVGLVLDEIELCEFKAWPGTLGLFEVPDEIVVKAGAP